MNTNTKLCIGYYEKAFGEYIGGSTVRYTWRCGHQRKETLMVGPKGRGSAGKRKPMSPEAVKMFAKYWGQMIDGKPHYGLSAGPCPTCVKIARATDPKLVQHLKRRRG